MLLLDSLYINNSGGKILLEYLVEKLEQNKIPVYYLFDERCIDDFPMVPKRRKVFMKANLMNRHRFYKRKKRKFSHVFCFGNLAPTIELNVPVYTYFHQPLFLEVPKSVSFSNIMKIKAKTIVLNQLKKNTNIWIVQSQQIRERLASKYEIDLNAVKVLPFYPPLQVGSKSYNRRKDGFAYISNGGPHKNHERLIHAFCNFFDKAQKGNLHLTISDEFPELKELITLKVSEGYPIINHGFITRNELVEIYQTNKYLVFPSLAESFGLGIVEAIENGCKVIGANLPYTFAVCKPSLIFDPLDVDDMVRAFRESQGEQVQPTVQLVFNQIDQIISLLQN